MEEWAEFCQAELDGYHSNWQEEEPAWRIPGGEMGSRQIDRLSRAIDGL